jgi:hypothetical protein
MALLLAAIGILVGVSRLTSEMENVRADVVERGISALRYDPFRWSLWLLVIPPWVALAYPEGFSVQGAALLLLFNLPPIILGIAASRAFGTRPDLHRRAWMTVRKGLLLSYTALGLVAIGATIVHVVD